MVTHAYSCRRENCWGYVSVCGLSWLSVGSDVESLVKAAKTAPGHLPPKARIGASSTVLTCRLCLRRLRAHTLAAEVARDVLRSYDILEPRARIAPEERRWRVAC